MKKKPHTGRRLKAAAVLLFLSAVLLLLAANRPGFAQWYARTVYPLLVGTLGRVSGWFPFSVSEMGIYVLLILFFVMLARLAFRCVRPGNSESADCSGGRQEGAAWLSGVLLAAGILLFLYTVCCGVNYHRKSFSEEEGIVTYRYSVQELKEICLWLTGEVNRIAGEVPRDAQGVMQLSPGGSEKEGAVQAMRHLAETFPSLEGYYPKPKELAVSQILSYQGLTGIYLPFTVEANYNGDMTPYNKPFTACHELSHLRGFMQEQEANFIAFLACISSERTDFRYSGYLSGWVYCMNALYRADAGSWQEVRATLAEEAEPDLAANNAFWERHEGMVSQTAERINDTYLKVNGQPDGVRSYDRMVDLIVAYFGDEIPDR